MARKNTPTIPQDPPDGTGLGPFGSDAEQEEEGPRHFNQPETPPAEAPTDRASSTPEAKDAKKSVRGMAPELQAMHRMDCIMAKVPEQFHAMIFKWLCQKYAPDCLRDDGEAQLGAAK